MEQVQTTSISTELGERRSFSHPSFPLFPNNILIQRGWKSLNASWRHSPLVWAILILGAAQTLFWLLAESILGRPLEQAVDEPIFFYYFLGFHLFIHCFVPIYAFNLVRRPATRSKVDAALVTPMPHRDIFWWLWIRSFAPWIVLVLIFYFAMWRPFPWLYAFGNGGEYWDADGWRVKVVSELGCTALIIGFFALPWIKSRPIRRFVLVLSFSILFVLSIALFGKFDFPLAAFTIHFHPLVTIPYFIFSIAWGAALGVFVALNFSGDINKAAILIIVMGPLAEWLVLNVFYLPKLDELYDGWWGLVAMLQFYMVSAGAFWMGLKWNLLIAMSRRRIPTR